MNLQISDVVWKRSLALEVDDNYVLKLLVLRDYRRKRQKDLSLNHPITESDKNSQTLQILKGVEGEVDCITRNQ